MGKRKCAAEDEKKGDLFAAPPNTLLVHACNTKGLWGAGIAASFRSRYRTAFKANKHHCATRPQSKLPGTSLLTPPDKTKVTIDDEQLRGRPPTDSLVKATHFIGNLYTSRGVGRKKDTKDVILQYTGPAMRDLLERVADWNAGDPQRKIERIWLCKINSGLFGVKWEETREVLRSVEVPDGDVPAEVLVLAKD
ncbi:hypothetical protein ANO11243_081940 [Dothideomycetidae sp. 11243]|nr:hypothetical protein ANO11243_081940 [fungal sp. No.11243]